LQKSEEPKASSWGAGRPQRSNFMKPSNSKPLEKRFFLASRVIHPNRCRPTVFFVGTAPTINRPCDQKHRKLVDFFFTSGATAVRLVRVSEPRVCKPDPCNRQHLAAKSRASWLSPYPEKSQGPRPPAAPSPVGEGATNSTQGKNENDPLSCTPHGPVGPYRPGAGCRPLPGDVRDAGTSPPALSLAGPL